MLGFVSFIPLLGGAVILLPSLQLALEFASAAQDCLAGGCRLWWAPYGCVGNETVECVTLGSLVNVAKDESTEPRLCR